MRSSEAWWQRLGEGCALQQLGAHLSSQAILGRVEAATQTELPIREAAVQVEGCKVCTPHSWVEEGASSTCARCTLVESLRQRMEELQEEVRRLCCIREGEQETEYYLRRCKKKY